MNKKECFQYFKTQPKNERWGWSGISEKGDTVAVTVWKDQLDGFKEKKPFWNTFSLPHNQRNELWKDQLGNKARIEHLLFSLKNLNGMVRVIITEAEKEDSFPRKIKRCYPLCNHWYKIKKLNENTGEVYLKFSHQDPIPNKYL